jgi:TnpA family transposase
VDLEPCDPLRQGSIVQHWQLPFLGLQAFPTELTAFEIGYFFTFTATVRAAIFSRYGDHHRLAAAIQIGFIKMTGRPLDAFDTLPIAVLRYLGTELEIVTPESTSLRALYGRRSTLYEHQAWAAELLGFRPFTERRQRTLTIQVRREAHKAVTIHRLVEFAKRWLYERRILIPDDRRLRDLARTAYGATEQTLLETIRRHIPAQVLESWREALFQPRLGYTSTLEWLQQAPRGKLGGLKEQLEKVTFLKALHVDAYALEDLRLERQRDYARHMRRRRPARFRALKDPRRTLEMVCFLRITLLQTTDVALSLADLLIQELHARTVKEVRDAESRVARTFKPTLREIRRVLHDPAMTDTALRRTILALMPSEHDLFPSRAAAVRWKLNEKARQVRPLLKALLTLPFEGEEGSSLTLALSQLRDLYAHERRALPRDVDIGFAPRWAVLMESPDRQRALRAFEAATLFALRKALRNGSAWIGHSLVFRRRNEILIPDTEWTAHHRRYYEQLGLPMHASGYTPQLLANLEAGLASLAEAVEADAVLVDAKGIHLKALEAEETPPLLETTKSELFKAVGVTQLPELIMAIDNETRFSWRLLGRAPVTEAELLLVYAALLAHGTELNAASVALMIPGLTEQAIADAMRLLEDEGPLREANELVVQFLHRHEAVKMWGEGTLASSDAMSLEASRYLWNARVDPRRRTYAMGIYSHVLDQWGIIYDQPLVLHQRQAGAAIEGVVRQTAAANVERLAVDTHGYTDVGMAIGKLLSLDLCPRLSHLRDRRLHVPRGLSVPAVLAPVVEPDVSLPQVEAGWDQLIRVAASIEGGWTSAVLALTRFGAASRADPIHKAGSALGQLLRTLFLCDFMSNEVFRREVLRILNHGESVHTLQRAIHFGSIAAARGRRREELVAISGSLTLLANVVMAWITQRIQQVLDDWHHAGIRRVEPEILRHIAPVHFQDINFRGVMQFPLARYRGRLIPAMSSRERQGTHGDVPR